MACEKCIITTNLPHIKEVCQDTVRYIKPYDWKAIVKQILYVERHPPLMKYLGKKARNRVKENYTIEKMVQSYIKIYKRLGL